MLAFDGYWLDYFVGHESKSIESRIGLVQCEKASTLIGSELSPALIDRAG